MERGSEPRRARRLARAWCLIAALLTLPATTLPAQGTDAGDGLDRGAFERPVERVGDGGSSFAGETLDSRSGAGVAADAPGLRRAGERSMRTRGVDGARSSTGGRLVRTLLWLVVVVGLAFGTLHLVRRFLPGAVTAQNRNLVRVIGRTAVGPKQQVVVTQVAGQLLILGVTPESIRRLGEITDPEQIARAVPPEETFAGRFASIQEVYGEDADETPHWEPPHLGDRVHGTSGPAEEGEVESRLEPYRREISRLQSMVETWQRDERRDERGTA